FCQLAAARGETPAALALRWVLSQQGVTSVIVGASSTAQLGESLPAAQAPALGADELAEVENIFGVAEE
ncbi:MAG: aldo/keto reductase, partial [Bacteroidales bacterium]|nr:aldo/keto reductase [Bacteroidales bacterium]